MNNKKIAIHYLQLNRREFEDIVSIDFLDENGFFIAKNWSVFPRVGAFSFTLQVPAIKSQTAPKEGAERRVLKMSNDVLNSIEGMVSDILTEVQTLRGGKWNKAASQRLRKAMIALSKERVAISRELIARDKQKQ